MISICLVGVLILGLQDICMAHVSVKYSTPEHLEGIYAASKQKSVHLGQIATLESEEKLDVCQQVEEGDYEVDMIEGKFAMDPHIYNLKISQNLTINEENGFKIRMAAYHELMDRYKNDMMVYNTKLVKKNARENKPKAQSEDKAGTSTAEGLTLEMSKISISEAESSEPALVKPESPKMPTKMIFNQDIGFPCIPKGSSQPKYVVTYGFAKQMYYVSKLTNESQREITLDRLMYAAPKLVLEAGQLLEAKFDELRKGTEAARADSSVLLDDIEKNDDISALTQGEKIILCAQIFDLSYYKVKGLKFIPKPENVKFTYEKLVVEFTDPQFKQNEIKYVTDCMMCKGYDENTKKDERRWVTRSYGDGGVVYTVRMEGINAYLDALVGDIPSLMNLKYLKDYPYYSVENKVN